MPGASVCLYEMGGLNADFTWSGQDISFAVFGNQKCRFLPVPVQLRDANDVCVLYIAQTGDGEALLAEAGVTPIKARGSMLFTRKKTGSNPLCKVRN